MTLDHPRMERVVAALWARDVIPDYRAPDAIRLAFPPLYSRFVDAWDAVDRLERLVAAGEHEQLDAALRRVT